MKRIVQWYGAQSKSKRAVLGCILLIGVFALYGLGSTARQSLAMVATPTPTSTPAPTATPRLTPAPTPPTPTSTPSPTPKSANSTKLPSGLPGFTHQVPGNVLIQQKTLPKISTTRVNKVPLHTTATPQATATATPQPQGTPTPTPTPNAPSGTATPRPTLTPTPDPTHG